MKLGHCVAAVAVVAAVAAWLAFRGGDEPAPMPEAPVRAIPGEKPSVDAPKPSRGRKNAGAIKRVRKAPEQRPNQVDMDEFPDEAELNASDRALVKEIRVAVEKKDEKAVLAFAKRAAKSGNADVRSGMVSALQWYGRNAMPELLTFMADRDDDVRGEALDAWIDALQEIESPTAKRDLLLSSMSAITDEDALEGMMTELSELPNSYQIDILVTLIEKGNSIAAKLAREEYEFLTDVEYTTRAAAEKWLAENPDDPVEVEDAIEKDKAEGVATPLAKP